MLNLKVGDPTHFLPAKCNLLYEILLMQLTPHESVLLKVRGGVFITGGTWVFLSLPTHSSHTVRKALRTPKSASHSKRICFQALNCNYANVSSPSLPFTPSFHTSLIWGREREREMEKCISYSLNSKIHNWADNLQFCLLKQIIILHALYYTEDFSAYCGVNV